MKLITIYPYMPSITQKTIRSNLFPLPLPAKDAATKKKRCRHTLAVEEVRRRIHNICALKWLPDKTKPESDAATSSCCMRLAGGHGPCRGVRVRAAGPLGGPRCVHHA
jgi:hypothetical protein